MVFSRFPLAAAIRSPLLVPLALMLLGLPMPCFGEQPAAPLDLNKLGIEELMQVEVATVYGASKYEQDVSEAPASVTLITADDIRKYGYRNLAEVLQSVRGFSINYDRNYHYAGIRGFSRPGDYNTRFLLLIDGVRLNDSVYDQAPIGTDLPLDMDLVERIEIIRGPSHSLYGSNAFFAVINIITRRGRDMQGVEASASGGSFSAYRGRLSYGNRFGSGLEALFSGSFTDSKGQNLYYREFDSPATNNGWANGCDGERSGSFFTRLGYGGLSLETAWNNRRKDVPTAAWGTLFGSPLTRTEDQRRFIDLQYDHHFAGKHQVVARLSYNRYDYAGDYAYEPAPPATAPSVAKDGATGIWWNGEVHVVSEIFRRHKILAGAEFRDNVRQDQWYRDETGLWQDMRRSFSWALFVQDEFQLLDNVTIHGGLRYDRFDTFGGTLNPRAALIYSPLADTTVKLLYGQAFRAPNAYELYYMTPNPTLREERMSSYEFIVEQGLTEEITLSATAFDNRMRDIISQVDTGSSDVNLPFRNSDSFETRGIELELQGKWESGFGGRASYSLQRAYDRKNGSTLPNSPNQLAKLNLIAPLVGKKLFLGLEEQFTGRKKTLAGSEAGSFFITNLTIFGQHLLPKLELSASIYNLFNAGYGIPGSGEHRQDIIQQDGRTFQVKVTYGF